MNRFLLALTALGVSALSFASTHASTADLAGTYELRLSDEAVALCRLMNAPVPQSKLVLTRDSHFKCDSPALGNEGTYEIERDALTFYGQRGGKPLRGTVLPDSIVLNGLHYQRVTSDSGFGGDWHVITASGREDRSIHFTFKEDGTFSFKGMGGSSRGRYEVDGNSIYLEYKEVDGERVNFDRRGRAVLTRDRGAFRIDNYWYERD
jgi:hypothetical protein